MTTAIVLTLIGPDRPGLVQSVAARVADLGGNWLESRLCRLGGQFAGIVRLSAPAAQQEGLVRALQDLRGEGLQVMVQVESGDQASAAAAVDPDTIVRFDVCGLDRPGILRSVTGVFASLGVNIEELSSGIASAPMGGGDLFQAQIRVRLPQGITLARVQAQLERIAADLMVDVTTPSVSAPS